MSFDITGKIFAKFDTIQRTESFRIREFVLEKTDEINGQIRSQYIKFQCTQDKTSLLDKLAIGEEVKLHFNIRGSRWEKDGKVSFITNLDVWKIEQLFNSSKPANELNSEKKVISDNLPVSDDLPF